MKNKKHAAVSVDYIVKVNKLLESAEDMLKDIHFLQNAVEIAVPKGVNFSQAEKAIIENSRKKLKSDVVHNLIKEIREMEKSFKKN